MEFNIDEFPVVIDWVVLEDDIAPSLAEKSKSSWADGSQLEFDKQTTQLDKFSCCVRRRDIFRFHSRLSDEHWTLNTPTNSSPSIIECVTTR